MPPSKVDDAELLDRLIQVFRTYGFEGASLSRISEATGLQRASLYHRFPGGKEEMARAVLQRAAGWLREHALKPLESSDQAPPLERLKRMGASLEAFYESGRRSCLLDALSFSDASDAVQSDVRAAMQLWSDKLAGSGRELGLSEAEASAWAEDRVVQIQGALVVSRVTGNAAVFERALAAVASTLGLE